MHLELNLQNRRLDSWKAISKYLDRGLRTVQRWHTEYEMPVRRISGTTGAVFAFTSELNTWLQARSGTPELSSFHENESSQSDRSRSSELTQMGKRMSKHASEENMCTIATVFRKAINLDLDNAEAWAELAHIELVAALTCSISCSIAYPRADAALTHALDTDPRNITAITNLALYKLAFERDWEGSRMTYLRLEKGKYTYGSLVGRALLKVVSGKLSEAKELLEEGAHLNPHDTPLSALLSWVLFLNRQYKDALAMVDTSRKCGDSGTLMTAVGVLAAIRNGNPNDALSQLEDLLAEKSNRAILSAIREYGFAVAGHSERAKAALQDLTAETSKDSHGIAYPIALICIALGEKQKAVQWLKRSYLDGSLWSLALHLDPNMDPLRGYPDFESLLRKLNYPKILPKQDPAQFPADALFRIFCNDES